MFTCPKCSHPQLARDNKRYVCPSCGENFSQYELCFGPGSVPPPGAPKAIGTRHDAMTPDAAVDRGSISITPYAPVDRLQTLTLIVQSALKREPWRTLYAYQMQVHQISEDAVIEEVIRRGGDDDRLQPNRVPRKPISPDDETSRKLPLPPVT